jgi:hypothetical protein
MLNHPEFPKSSRHARLFELIRQRNLAEAARHRAPAPAISAANDELIFLQAAERSLGGETVSAAIL